MDSRPAGGRPAVLTADITPAIGWLVGMMFAFIDALTTWYALTTLDMQEGNPVGTWAIEHLGLSRALALRIIIGAVVLGLIAWGCVAPVPRHQRMVHRACRGLLIGALVLWGFVAVSNTLQIAYVRFA
jgi:Domain of unknown function (DUF5658)